MQENIENFDAKKHIIIKGARQHNLKNVDVAIPRKQLVVVTGVSGSGKSSLTIDTLYAEGQRRYVESLSSYARQFLNRMDKPDVDYIRGICPAIAIEQKVSTRTSRSTVGTLTEIYDYLRILYARLGKTYSPKSGELVTKDSVTTVVNAVMDLTEGSRCVIMIPIKIHKGRTLEQELSLLLQKGFSRLWYDGKLLKIEGIDTSIIKKSSNLHIIIDRIAVKESDTDLPARVADSAQVAFDESNGDCLIEVIDGERLHFSNRFERDGQIFEEPSPHLFNFNNPFGACKRCEGFGQTIGIDADLVFPNKNLSVYEDAVAPWKGEKMGKWKEALIAVASQIKFPIHRPVKDLTEAEMDLLWEGNEYFEGIKGFFKYLEGNSYKMHYRILMARYRGRTLCPECKGARLRKDTQYVKIDGKTINQLVMMPIDELKLHFENIQLNEYEQTIAKRVLIEVNNRLQFMCDVGLGYLTLNRLSSTLSGGETQRINLTRTLGSNLTNSLYILDEPSIGLHPRDTTRLIKVLKNLRDLGNTVVVVEHEEDVIRSADYIIDMGPFAGRLGGEVIFSDSAEAIMVSKESLTGKYLREELMIDLPQKRRKASNYIEIQSARLHNLKDFDVKFPLNALTVVTGVSGSGKTTLVKDVLYPCVSSLLSGAGQKLKHSNGAHGDWKQIKQIELINQSPLGRSSRSNPVTYVKAYDAIRKLFSDHKLSKVRGYKPKHFSFNVEGGRCEECKGEGFVTVEMQFLADVQLKCDECQGLRFKPELLEIKYKNKHITEVLEMTIDEAIEFFADKKEIIKKLQPLQDVGLGYVQLGQSSSTLSGGEAQRVKLASFLTLGKRAESVLFIFDEPTTGLHFHDISKLLASLNALVENGHSVIVIEHNLDVIKCADWIIDLGPGGGINGGHLLYQGTPESIIDIKESFTGQYLKGKLSLTIK